MNRYLRILLNGACTLRNNNIRQETEEQKLLVNYYCGMEDMLRLVMNVMEEDSGIRTSGYSDTEYREKLIRERLEKAGVN